LVPANGDMARARRSFDAIRVAYSALDESIYATRLVIFTDRQNTRQQIDSFNATYPALALANQILEAPVGSLEEFYPQPWKRHEEDEKLSGDEKVQLAREVGDAITRHQFENEMPELFNALSRAWELAF